MPRTNHGQIDNIFSNNRKWAANVREQDPEFFSRWSETQKPQYLWIGCSDSRVVAEAMTGLSVGELFVHRNIGNVLSHSDTNSMSTLEYAVKALGVKHVFVCGHTNCGAVKAALTLPSSSAMLTNCWISQIRDVRNQHADELMSLSGAEQVKRLAELNVAKQVYNVCTSPVVQQVWQAGEQAFVHGLLYDVATGELSRIAGPIGGNQDAGPDLQALKSSPSLGAITGKRALEGCTLASSCSDMDDTDTESKVPRTQSNSTLAAARLTCSESETDWTEHRVTVGSVGECHLPGVLGQLLSTDCASADNVLDHKGGESMVHTDSQCAATVVARKMRIHNAFENASH